MIGFRKARAPLALASVALLVAACQQESTEPETDPASQRDSSRSIFADEAASRSAESAASLPPLETTLSFADGTPELTEATLAELATVLDSPQVEAGGPIILRGHSDSEGSDEDNLEASRDQAEAVRAFLVENGIDEARIRVIAFGEQNPIAPNALPDGSPNEEGRAQNRRVELTVATGRGSERQQTLIETLTSPSAEAGATSDETPSGSPASAPAE